MKISFGNFKPSFQKFKRFFQDNYSVIFTEMSFYPETTNNMNNSYDISDNSIIRQSGRIVCIF